MRIIAGKWRGRRLAEPRTMDIRPTTDRAKEGLFNIINYYIEGSDFLDLFAGACGVGFEAKSRGANRVICVDNSQESKRVFNMNEEKINSQIEFVNSDVNSFLQRSSDKFDYIFLDPPYDMDGELVANVIKSSKALLKTDGQIILEFPRYQKVEVDNMELFKEKKYGKSAFYFYKEINE